jgi:transposase
MDESGKAPRIEVQNIDHLGIVAGLIDEAGLVEEIDQKVGSHPHEHVSCGQAVKAMILNGLGFLSAPLYLFEEFFNGKATEHLIGPGVRPEHLNDDRLGRVLDKLFEAGLTELFVGVASKAAERFAIPTASSVHLDATSFHLHGQYDDDDDDDDDDVRKPEEIRVTYGYSRDHRPDLKQFVVDLMSTGDGGVPLFFRVADGNEADQAVFAELLREFRARLKFDTLFVADAALYGAQNLASLKGLRWLCRVPRTLEEARRALAETPREAFARSATHEGYRIAETKSDYGGVEQRWLVVHSEELRKAARERLERRLRRRERELGRELARLSRKRPSLAGQTRGRLRRRSPPSASASITGSQPLRRGSSRWPATASLGGPLEELDPKKLATAWRPSWNGTRRPPRRNWSARGATYWPPTSSPRAQNRPLATNCLPSTRGATPSRGGSGSSKTPCSSPQACS